MEEGSGDPRNKRGERTGPKARKADGRDRGRGGQATKSKTIRREEKWGKEEGRGIDRGQMAMQSMGSGSKGERQAAGAGHKRAGGQTELPKRRRRRWRSGVETQQGKTQRERELERAGGRPWGGERGGGRGQGAC